MKENSHASLARKTNIKNAHGRIDTPLAAKDPILLYHLSSTTYITYFYNPVAAYITTERDRTAHARDGARTGLPRTPKKELRHARTRAHRRSLVLLNNYSTILRFLQYNFRKSQIEQNPLLLFVYFYQKNIFFS